MSRTRHRPSRGRNPIVSGDTGPRQPQGGAKPGASESGDLAAREFGVPQADIPGGQQHLVNPQTRVTKPPGVPERPADAHKYHGVPSDTEDYTTPGDASEIGTIPTPNVAEPVISDAVPVYMTQAPGHKRKIRKFVPVGRRVLAANGADGAIQLFNRDPDRVQVWIQNENNTAANAILIGDEESMREAAQLLSAGGTIQTIFGFAMPGNKGAQNFDTQDRLFCVNAATTAVTVSWAVETEMEEATHGG